jgi:hypothetical protein
LRGIAFCAQLLLFRALQGTMTAATNLWLACSSVVLGANDAAHATAAGFAEHLTKTAYVVARIVPAPR